MSDSNGFSGLFISLEGIEGAGKSTQVSRLAETLAARGHEVLVTHEPGGGGRVGETLRALLKDPTVWRDLGAAEIFLYAADRAHHLESVILPALERGEIVLCDRFIDSTRAYQGAGRGRCAEVIEALHALDPLSTRPRRTLLFDIEPRIGLARARSRGSGDGAGYDDEDLSFFERVRAGYLQIAAVEPERVRIIDADGPTETVTRRALEALDDLPEVRK